MRIYWVSRHEPTPRQLAALGVRFGQGVGVVRDPDAFSDADEILRRYRLSGCDDLLVVAPLSVLDALCQRGVRPIWAEMEEVPPSHPEAEVHLRGRRPRSYRFREFRRVRRLALETDPL